MIMWLDHKLWGNGRGMKSPFFDDRFYWLVDTAGGERQDQNGQLYVWSGYLGAQLASFQWTRPRMSERRELCGRLFKPFQVERRGPRVRVSWTWIDLPEDLDAAHAAIAKLQEQLGRT